MEIELIVRDYRLCMETDRKLLKVQKLMSNILKLEGIMKRNLKFSKQKQTRH